MCIKLTMTSQTDSFHVGFSNQGADGKTLQQPNVGMLEWREFGNVRSEHRALCLSMPRATQRKPRCEIFLNTLSLCQKKKLIALPNLQTAAISSFHPPLSREFNEKPITRLSWSSLSASASHIAVEFNWVHEGPIGSVPSLFCAVRAFSKTCAATRSPVCLQTFFFFFTPPHQHQLRMRGLQEWQKDRERGREKEVYNFY